MLLGVSFIFLPVVIVLVMSRIFRSSLLESGERSKLMIFAAICILTYGGLLYLIAQVNG